MNTQPFIQTGQMIELCCEYLSVRYTWLYVIAMSCKLFGMNLHSIVAWMSRNSLLETALLSKEFLDIQETIGYRFTLKRLRDMI